MSQNTLGYIAVASFLIAAAGFLLTHFERKTTAQMRADILLLQKQVQLFWGIVEKEIGNMLHSPHRAELDRLIEKNASGEKLEPDEIKKFAELLQQLAEDKDTTHGEQTAAVVLKAAVLARHVSV